MSYKAHNCSDIGVQALTIRELRKYIVDIVIPDDGHLVIKVPDEETCYHICHSRVMDNN